MKVTKTFFSSSLHSRSYIVSLFFLPQQGHQVRAQLTNPQVRPLGQGRAHRQGALQRAQNAEPGGLLQGGGGVDLMKIIIRAPGCEDLRRAAKDQVGQDQDRKLHEDAHPERGGF